MLEPAIQVHNLKKSYGNAEVVHGVSFDVHRGEVFGLLGSNGAGKTTTLEILEGQQIATSGTVTVFGRHPRKDRRTLRPRIGIMQQEAGFFADLTVAETITIWQRFTARPRSLGETIDLVNLAHRASVAVRQLSGGERRRLDLGLALLGHPELLFLDEPSTGLDPEARRDMWGLVRELVAAGTTVLLTTHYLEEAEQLADRVAIMDGGRVVTTGSVEEVLRGGAGRFTFRLPVGASVADLPRMLGITVTAAGDQVAMTGQDLDSVVDQIFRWAISSGYRLQDVQIRPMSLEDLYLQVTGVAA